nr:S24 family peptidase [Paramuribaculum intestinale]
MQAKVQNISPIKQRILKFAGTLGVSKRDFYKSIGVSRGTLESKTGITEEVMAKFIAAYPQISIEWLMTGKGGMIHDALPTDSIVVKEPPVSAYVSKDLDTGSIDRANPGATRPRIPFTAAAGALSIATNTAGDADCERLPVIATFPAYDFTIKIEGDSMAPDYLSGDELACRFVDDPANIKWGEPHILDTRDGVVFKIPYFGGDQIMCRSINPDGPSFLVDRADVLHVASIVGFTRQLQS